MKLLSLPITIYNPILQHMKLQKKNDYIIVEGILKNILIMKI